ncbi:hypothetical protein RRF57_011361 [Xylaria bambusicola]|uniref:Ankyrin repeat protein n=1 Tax=Xylaria bambusicola TaxID=326684 RepID=A0AAN7UWL8_9PEZI
MRSTVDQTMKTTLLASLINGANLMNIISLEQIEYMLNLTPRPRFVSDTEGGTLLHYAVAAWLHDGLRSNPIIFAVLKLLLSTFPESHYIEAADQVGCTTLHWAAYGSNLTAIQIIYDHLKATGQEIDVNRRNIAGDTALDMLGEMRDKMKLDSVQYRATIKQYELRTAKTYEYLRDHGAYYRSEWRGVTICCMARVQTDVENETGGTDGASFVLDCCWRYDQFILRGSQMMTSAVNRYMEARITQRFQATKGGAEYPWLKTKHAEELWGHKVEWTRQGRCWTIREREELVTGLKAAWETLFPAGSSVQRMRC